MIDLDLLPVPPPRPPWWARVLRRAADGGEQQGGAPGAGGADGASEGGARDGGASEGGASEGGASEGGASEGGASEGGASEGGRRGRWMLVAVGIGGILVGALGWPALRREVAPASAQPAAPIIAIWVEMLGPTGSPWRIDGDYVGYAVGTRTNTAEAGTVTLTAGGTVEVWVRATVTSPASCVIVVDGVVASSSTGPTAACTWTWTGG